MGNVGSAPGSAVEGGVTQLDLDATRYQETLLWKPELLARVALENGDRGFGPSKNGYSAAGGGGGGGGKRGAAGAASNAKSGGAGYASPQSADLTGCDPEALAAATAVAAHAQCSVVRSLDDPLSLVSEVSDLAVWATAVGDSDSLLWDEVFRRRDRVMVLLFSRMRRQLVAAQAATRDERRGQEEGEFANAHFGAFTTAKDARADVSATEAALDAFGDFVRHAITDLTGGGLGVGARGGEGWGEQEGEGEVWGGQGGENERENEREIMREREICSCHSPRLLVSVHLSTSLSLHLSVSLSLSLSLSLSIYLCLSLGVVGKGFALTLSTSPPSPARQTQAPAWLQRQVGCVPSLPPSVPSYYRIISS